MAQITSTFPSKEDLYTYITTERNYAIVRYLESRLTSFNSQREITPKTDCPLREINRILTGDFKVFRSKTSLTYLCHSAQS